MRTGGLGDVMGALPKALARRGHRTMAVVPRYSNYEEGWETGVRIRLRVMGSDTEVQRLLATPFPMLLLLLLLSSTCSKCCIIKIRDP